MKGKQFRCIGRLTKLHGFEGEAVIIAEGLFPKKFDKTEWVFLKIDGLPVPFFVSKIAIRSDSSAIIKLLDVTSTKEMQEFLGLEVFVEETSKSKISKSVVNKDDIRGYKVVDAKLGDVGLAETILNLNGNYLLQLFQNGKEILIPVNEEFISEIDDKQKIITITVPEGLIDLNG